MKGYGLRRMYSLAQCITSITIPNSVNSVHQSPETLGDFTSTYFIYGRNSGTYIKQGNNWVSDGVVMPRPAVLTTSVNAWIVSINGRKPTDYYNYGTYSELRGRIQSRMAGSFPYPAHITEFYNGTFYLRPGEYTIEAIFMRRVNTSVSFSTDTRVFNQRFTFEDGTYTLNVEELPENRLRFSIDHRN